MQNNDSGPDQARPPTSVNAYSWQRTAIVVVVTALIAGASGYLLGLRTAQNSSQGNREISLQPLPTQGREPYSPIPFVPKTFYPVPTTNPVLTANWKTYTNAQWHLSFKYPETWFPQKVPLSSHQGDDAFNFYPVGVTPHPGEAGDPSNAVFGIQSAASQENMLNAVSPPAGFQRVIVDGKPAVKGDGFCYIKLSSTSWIVLFGGDDEERGAAKRSDTIISTISFTNQ
jgi:hypothetical protein